MFWTRKHQIESSNNEGFFKKIPCCRQFLQEFYKVQTTFVGFFHARCLNFPCSIKSWAACMHAFCMFYLLGFTRVHFAQNNFHRCVFETQSINTYNTFLTANLKKCFFQYNVYIHFPYQLRYLPLLVLHNVVLGSTIMVPKIFRFSMFRDKCSLLT